MVQENAKSATYTLESRVFEENHKYGQKMIQYSMCFDGIQIFKGVAQEGERSPK